ncbi:MAG: 30S ribosomal protein S9 [Cyanobacteria bacterium HKST-UBA04]|nr:30S ribosomal protein S9 [Cyanobacteria bacterium HKST-UBA04]MCA9841789.1 30S ribosomal protein S9 [Cyanobacteria bacterium HKST-UBA03]
MGYPQNGQRGTGRRKEAIARVRLLKGTGKFLVNNATFEEYFGQRHALVQLAIGPLKLLELDGKYNILAKVHGGGKTGQAGAIRLGLARALAIELPDLAKLLKDGGYLTRDARVKERKKYGLHKARKRPQYSKR